MKITHRISPTVDVDTRLAGVEQASMSEIEAAVAVAAAPTAALAFDLLSDLAVQQTRRDLLAACVLADAACTTQAAAVELLADRIARGGAMIAEELSHGRGVPEDWLDLMGDLTREQATALDVLCAAELARLEAVWALDAHDADYLPIDVVVFPGDPWALAARLITPAVRRVGGMDVPDGPWYVAAMAEVDRHGPGWDVTNTKAACRALVVAAVQSKHGAPS